MFRVGIWHNYFLAMTPNIGPIDTKVVTDATSALADKLGPMVLGTHSHSGGFGWITAMKNKNVRAIVCYEPGSGFPFPEGELPAPIESSSGQLETVAVTKAAFEQLTKIPIVIYYGDNIPARPDPNPVADGWGHGLPWPGCG